MENEYSSEEIRLLRDEQCPDCGEDLAKTKHQRECENCGFFIGYKRYDEVTK